MPSFSFTLSYTQANALRSIMAIAHPQSTHISVEGDITLSHFFEELSRYLDGMDDYSAQVALESNYVPTSNPDSTDLF